MTAGVSCAVGAEDDPGTRGRSDRRDRHRWPLRDFARVEEFTGGAVRAKYSAENLAAPVREVEVSRQEAAGLPRDALSGAGAVELVLTELLRPR